MSRAERIHQRSRVRARVLRVIATWSPFWSRRDKAAIGRMTNHGLKTCSCWVCGNPRHFGKGGGSQKILTMQERRIAAAELDD